jgi:type I restriction enzyme, S subunit
MKSNYKRLGAYIEPVNQLNDGMEVNELLGISNQKFFQNSHTNTIGIDLSTYRIVRTGQFAYNRATTRNGDKISIALRQGNDCIVSPSYRIFRSKDENVLNSEYLMMWFRRPEFDRYARFKSHGSAHEFFEWDQMTEVELPIPHIDKQREIVKEYNTIETRIALNQQMIQKLEETAQAVYREWFVEGIDLENLPEGWRMGHLSELCEYSNSRVSINEISLETYISTENMLQDRAGITIANGLPTANGVTGFDNGNILISNIRPYFKKIWLANFSGGCSNDVLCFVPKHSIPSLYLYQILEKDNFFDYVMAGSKGTKMPRGDKKWIMNFETIIPSGELIEKFSIISKKLQNEIQRSKQENQKLTELKAMLLSRMAGIN